MKENKIHRQHETTSIPELHCALCSKFKAVTSGSTKRHSLFFIQLSNVWHRFYLDAGILFWEEGLAPDPSEDLLEGDYYRDIGKELQIERHAISGVTMFNSRLVLEFKNGARLTLKSRIEEDGADIDEFVVGR